MAPVSGNHSKEALPRWAVNVVCSLDGGFYQLMGSTKYKHLDWQIQRHHNRKHVRVTCFVWFLVSKPNSKVLSEMTDQLPSESDIDPPAQLFNWNPGCMAVCFSVTFLK